MPDAGMPLFSDGEKSLFNEGDCFDGKIDISPFSPFSPIPPMTRQDEFDSEFASCELPDFFSAEEKLSFSWIQAKTLSLDAMPL